jgi:hypothetical protein
MTTFNFTVRATDSLARTGDSAQEMDVIPPVSYSYWNPADKSANATLSSANKIATSSATATAWVRSVIAKTTGKWRVEFVIVNFASTTGVGFAHTGDPGIYLGGNTVGYSLYGNYGSDTRRYHNGSYSQFSASAYSNGDVIGLIIDLDARKAWWDRNGTIISGDPAAGTGEMSGINAGDIYLAADPFGAGASIQLRTDPAEMTYAAPAGFTNGWPD